MSNITLKLNIISPEKQLFSGEVHSVVFPGTAGKFGILPKHAPLISSLKKGEIVYKIADEEYAVPVERGIVEVSNGVVTACVEPAVQPK